MFHAILVSSTLFYCGRACIHRCVISKLLQCVLEDGLTFVYVQSSPLLSLNRIITRLTLELAIPVYHLINNNVCMSGIHPFSLVRYSTMSCALHLTATLSISGVTPTLSSSFRRFPLALLLEDDIPASILSTSILTSPRSLRWMAMMMGRLLFHAGVAP